MPSRKSCKGEVVKELLCKREYRHRLFLWKRSFLILQIPIRRELCLSPRKSVPHRRALPKSEPSCPLLPEQQEFHQHLRRLAQSAVRTGLELVMREELDAFIGAAWGE